MVYVPSGMSVVGSAIVSSSQKNDLNSLCTQNGTNMEHHVNMGLLRTWTRMHARRVPPCVCMLLLMYGTIGSKKVDSTRTSPVVTHPSTTRA